jgi:hypothetical protein
MDYSLPTGTVQGKPPKDYKYGGCFSVEALVTFEVVQAGNVALTQ